MRHVFVETNWLHDYAAPAHHKVPEAVRLLERAQQGEFIVHIPNVSFAEARQSIQSKSRSANQWMAPESTGTFAGHREAANWMKHRPQKRIVSRTNTYRA